MFYYFFKLIDLFLQATSFKSTNSYIGSNNKLHHYLTTIAIHQVRLYKMRLYIGTVFPKPKSRSKAWSLPW